ncbi:hypothetical protein C8F04DRAFT_1063920 [Mycena alexandri]|uniref:Protein kinase domain-containing protein n=1 Tax=Mycena alexandri TaxID=1745969 RepID=A0AAD6TGS4_9AGAR|nr:hypothetical protein C8F04DRAFT_1063920 [Mycena alexandri]
MATGTYSENGPPSMENATFAAEGGTFFARSRGFTINSSVLNNFAGYAATPGVPPDVRTITMGDIDLQRQLRPDELRFDDNASVVGHERRRGCVRRVYSAKLEGHNSDMTVAVYDGDTAKQEWHRDIAKHTRMRHPNILQIYGIASANGVHAALFHGDLIPYKHFLNLYKHSPVLTVYIVASTAAQFWEAAEYWGSRFSKCYLLTQQYTLWIRPSTGLLSADFTPTKHDAEEHMSDVTIRNPLLSFSTLNLEPMVIDCMRLQEYHQACGSLCHYERNWIPSSAPVTIGAVVSWPLRHQYEDSLQIACLDLELDLQLDPFPRSLVTENGWNQYSISALLSNYRTPKFRFQAYAGACNIWLSQANHILNSLHINNSLQDYTLLEYVEFTMDIQRATEEPSTGYLFVCPASHFRIGPVSFKWPDCPAYWSFDSSGSERLSPDEATRLGFPSLKLATRVGPYSWDTSVYAGLRQFHTGKGFDPDSQDVARHLDYPLFQISNHAEDRFAHVNCEHGSAAEDAEDIRATSEAPPSRAFGFLINLQLALISFLALCRVYERMY